MRYYIIEQDKMFTNAPHILNWFGKIDVEKMKMGSYSLLKESYLLKIRGNADVDFIDVISEPFFLVTNMVRFVMQAYEPNLTFTDCNLFHGEQKAFGEYYIPHFAEYNCLTEKSQVNRDRSVVEHAEIDLHKIMDKSVFVLEGLGKKHVVVRDDLLESLLRRGLRGAKVRKVNTIHEVMLFE
ncbi:hypothetical protein [Anaeromicropila populeti]|uniref:Uncharacterized protein n=1 Tax=Anaeromicropila populeti TaxID=37658 RepID=A0A1I6IAR8_9FIRM|nr:hypothetical protein [Anaeromicropila populeti]SFR63885.1 hypothetical protein SAMN05661086_00639 [Anaeromicropila populeti]